MQIKNLIKELPWHSSRVWKKRDLRQINKIIIHQELGESSIENVNTYHISVSPQNHITPKGCPHLCYHYAIRKDGEIIQANELSDIVWHCKGQNTSGIGIMLQGNFSGPGYDMGTSEPTLEQIKSTNELVDFLLESLQLSSSDVFGHYHFGKPACPGFVMQEWVENKRGHISAQENPENIEKTIPEIQSRLNELGYNCGKADGIIGTRTQSAIRRFQTDNQLIADGIVGPQTWSKLLKLTLKS
ncbi:N-acetylmuramoyl-L-alanine amidase [Sunxiuqinia elliptica]|uniref:Putative peptidoglycan binding protein n=1 Tax=Sunxiuqinia elliptica TaxID=655355 RepID=A0A4R6GWW5_9BACT|nr:N-acetylmuramoyl-L-alanine amidase [Sunxiuqinia elliptica]TDO00043.1 putative peptidoglycan binding protein [Sunxiuqinia elliptica]TDO57234.1 putative peptidoglycan binding protein [Sunxiuqinia elliptica]